MWNVFSKKEISILNIFSECKNDQEYFIPLDFTYFRFKLLHEFGITNFFFDEIHLVYLLIKLAISLIVKLLSLVCVYMFMLFYVILFEKFWSQRITQFFRLLN